MIINLFFLNHMLDARACIIVVDRIELHRYSSLNLKKILWAGARAPCAPYGSAPVQNLNNYFQADAPLEVVRTCNTKSDINYSVFLFIN